MKDHITIRFICIVPFFDLLSLLSKEGFEMVQGQEPEDWSLIGGYEFTVPAIRYAGDESFLQLSEESKNRIFVDYSGPLSTFLEESPMTLLSPYVEKIDNSEVMCGRVYTDCMKAFIYAGRDLNRVKKEGDSLPIYQYFPYLASQQVLIATDEHHVKLYKLFTGKELT